MKINVLLPDGKKTVDFAELKQLIFKGDVTPETVVENSAGKQAPAKKIAELKPFFDLAAKRQSAAKAQAAESPSAPPVAEPTPTPAPPQTPNAPDFLELLQRTASPDSAPPGDDGLYGLADDAPAPPSVQPTPTNPPVVPDASSQPFAAVPPIAASGSDSSTNGAYYFEAKTPIPFVPKRFRSSKKGFYVDSLKALRSAELTHLVAWGRRFLLFFDVLFITAAIIYFLVLLGLGGMLHALIATTVVFTIAAFLYGLVTILFRILFSAADLYAASFRDDFDPAANQRRDNLLASVETIKTNGAAVATAAQKTNDGAE